jgi:hypothetical protein
MANGIQVVFDCRDPNAMAAFWSEALGYIVQPPPPGFDSWPEFLRSIGWAEEDMDRASAIIDPDERGPRVYFQKVPEGKVVKNRVHLDVNVAADVVPEEQGARLRSEAERLSALGAVELYERHETAGHWITMQDPEGNEFCLQ